MNTEIKTGSINHQSKQDRKEPNVKFIVLIGFTMILRNKKFYLLQKWKGVKGFPQDG